MNRFMVAVRRTVFVTCLLVAAIGAGFAHAGSIYLIEVVDPPTTAGAGVPTAGGFNVTSSRSGLGSWHLYAIDDADGSAGIRSFFVKLNPGPGGTIPATNNRSPITQYDDDATFGNGNGPFNAGFNDVRTTTPIIGAGQGATNPNAIAGYGITAGNFSTIPGALSFNAGSTTSGQWGVYAPGDGVPSGTLADGHVRKAVFLAEGTYTGTPGVAYPRIDVTTSFASGGSGVNFWNATGFPNSGSSTVTGAGTSQSLFAIYILAPEPATGALVGLAILGMAGFVRRRQS